jgi:hypothetical protein
MNILAKNLSERYTPSTSGALLQNCSLPVDTEKCFTVESSKAQREVLSLLVFLLQAAATFLVFCRLIKISGKQQT